MICNVFGGTLNHTLLYVRVGRCISPLRIGHSIIDPTLHADLTDLFLDRYYSRPPLINSLNYLLSLLWTMTIFSNIFIIISDLIRTFCIHLSLVR